MTVLIVNLALALQPDPSWDEEAPVSDCSRSEAADAASLIYGDAEEALESATVALEFAAAAAQYARAARAIPTSERAGKQGTKYVEKAHEAYLKAFTDTAAARDQRQAWLSDDQELLEEQLALAQAQREAEDPCIADTDALETDLRLVATLQAQLQDAATDGPNTPPPPLPAVATAAAPVKDKPSRPLIVGGAVALGVGVGLGAGALIAGQTLVASADRRLPDSDPGERGGIFRSGRAGNALTITGIVLIGVGVLVGVPLLAVGGSRASKARRISLRPGLHGIEGRF